MADAIQTLPNTKNDLIVAMVQKELIARSVVAPLVTDLSAFAIKGSKSFNVPKLTSFTVANRAFGAAQDATALVDSFDQIELNINAYIAWVEDHADIFQSSLDYRMIASQRAASAHAKYLDTQVINGLVAAAHDAVGAGTDDITKDFFLEMRKGLLENDADLSKLKFVASIDQESKLLAINDFVRADAYGTSNIPNGVIGRLYGVPVYISNILTGQQCLMFDTDGYGLALQQAPNMSEQNANQYGSKGVRVAIDQVFGHGGLQLGEKSVGATESPLIIKLN
jgi:hypothetical protein